MNNQVKPFNGSLFCGESKKDWLILGKGPTSEKFTSDLSENYNVIALNHAMRGRTALIGHAIDIEVFEQMDEGSLDGIEYLCVPWLPHVRKKRAFYKGKAFFGPGRYLLPYYTEQSTVLRKFLQCGKLLSYNLCSAAPEHRNPTLLDVDGYSFSAAVVVQLLAKAGIKKIRTLGIDGGNSYGSSFSDLVGVTKLQTHQPTFNIQFAEIAKTMNDFKLSFGPLDAEIPARIYVGCMPEQDLAFRVLEYSIKRHSSISVKLERLDDAIKRIGIDVPVPRAPENRGRTPFSFQRFTIPQLCGFKGRAVYLDSDMLIVQDFRSLWLHDMQGRQMVSVASAKESEQRPQFSVMLIDAEKLNWRISDIINRLDGGEFTYEQLMYHMASVQDWSASLPETWNSLDRYDPGDTCLIHFTDMDGQPWLNPLHPLAAVWSRYLIDAVREGAIEYSFVENEVASGNVRPSLLMQIKLNQDDPRKLPYATLTRDLVEFFPPHRRVSSRLSRFKHELYRARKFLKYLIKDFLFTKTYKKARSAFSKFLSVVER